MKLCGEKKEKYCEVSMSVGSMSDKKHTVYHISGEGVDYLGSLLKVREAGELRGHMFREYTEEEIKLLDRAFEIPGTMSGKFLKCQVPRCKAYIHLVCSDGTDDDLGPRGKPLSVIPVKTDEPCGGTPSAFSSIPQRVLN